MASLFEPVTLAASAKRITTSQGDALRLFDVMPAPADIHALEFVLGVTSIAGIGTDTLDATIQTRLDDSNWVDVAHFTQIVGTDTAAKRVYAKIDTSLATTMFEAGTALTAGNVRNLFGRDWRAAWTVSNASVSTCNFTFDIKAVAV